jgi:hypothetical protein
MTHKMVRTTFDTAEALFRCHVGLLRMIAPLPLGIHPRTLYIMRDEGLLEELSLGLYRLAEFPLLGAPDLLAVARKNPAGVVCLISALTFHPLISHGLRFEALPLGFYVRDMVQLRRFAVEA